MTSLLEEGVKVAETALLEDSYVKMAKPAKTAEEVTNTDPATAAQIQKDAELAAALQESFVTIDAPEQELSNDETKNKGPRG